MKSATTERLSLISLQYYVHMIWWKCLH